MRGLLTKDFCCMRQNRRTLVLIVILYLFIGMGVGSSGMAGMMVFLSAMMSITLFSYDDLAKWDSFALSMPVSRGQVVTARYLVALIMMLGGILLAAATMVITSVVRREGSTLREQLMSLTAVAAMALVFLGVLIPLCYRLGVEKARVWMMILVLVPTLLIVVASKMGPASLAGLASIPEAAVERFLFLVLPLIGAAVFAASYGISRMFYGRKEF